jgi:hypothetical protein
LSNNLIFDPCSTFYNGRLALKLHAPEGSTELGTWTEYVNISENIFRGTTEVVSIGPESTGPDSDSIKQVDERVRNVLFEKNTVLPTTIGQNDQPTTDYLVVAAKDVTVRNNIFAGSGSSVPGNNTYLNAKVAKYTSYEGSHSSPDPTNVSFLNNVFYETKSGKNIEIFPWTDTKFTNNAVYSVNGSEHYCDSNSVGDCLVKTFPSGNTIDVNPGFISTTYGDPNFLKLK